LIKKIGLKLRSSLNPRITNSLILVSDGAGWILDEVTKQLVRHLPADLHAVADLDSKWTRSRNSLVHFISRGWAWSDGLLDKADKSNKYIGLWWHGRFDSPDTNMIEALNRMSRLQGRLAAIQVPTSIARHTVLQAGLPEEKVVLIPEGLDCKRFRPQSDPSLKKELRARYGIPQDAFVIGSFQKDGVGWGDGMEPKLIKGPDIFADAMALLSNELPVFVLIPGPARGYLRQRLTNAKVPHLNPGHITHEGGLADLYHTLDIYVSASRDEGGPAGVMEAMASGIPVISSESGLAVDVFGDNENGILVPVEDSASIVAAGKQLFFDPALRLKLGANGHRAIQAYDWEDLAQQYYERLYKPILATM
jgi:glycosyltransferase involved in cell wall biosynthesis